MLSLLSTTNLVKQPDLASGRDLGRPEPGNAGKARATGGTEMRNPDRHPRRKRPGFVGHPAELGTLLADLRRAQGLSLRQVERATGKAVSNAYLSQLENGKIQKPSPNVLQCLAEVYGVPYDTLMERAGYLLPSAGDAVGRRRRLKAFAIDDLTAEEEEELLKYLAFLRSRGAS